MPLTIYPETNFNWNENKLSVVDGVSAVMVSIHERDDAPDMGTTVSIDRTEFLNLCKAFIAFVPPEDQQP